MRFGAGWLSVGVAALLLTTGCKEGKLEQKQEGEQASAAQTVEQEQEQSEKALGRAQDAQEQAREKQEQAAQAQQDVQKAQQELEESQAKARAEAQQAQQAQQQAQQETQQAGQTVADAQQDALEAQQQQQAEQAQAAQDQAREAQQQARQEEAQPPAATAQTPPTPAPAGEQLVIGEVLTASDQEVLVSTRGEPQVRLQVEPGTVIIVDGRQARAADIREGSQVRASYRDLQGEPTAVRIEVVTAPGSAAPPVPESGESQPGAEPQESPFQED